MNPNLNLNFILRAVFLTFSLRIDACLWTLVATLGNCPLKYFFHGISASTDSSHIGEKSDNKGDGGGDTTDGHAVSDPKPLYLHVWRPST